MSEGGCLDCIGVKVLAVVCFYASGSYLLSMTGLNYPRLT